MVRSYFKPQRDTSLYAKVWSKSAKWWYSMSEVKLWVLDGISVQDILSGSFWRQLLILCFPGHIIIWSYCIIYLTPKTRCQTQKHTIHKATSWCKRAMYKWWYSRSEVHCKLKMECLGSFYFNQELLETVADLVVVLHLLFMTHPITSFTHNTWCEKPKHTIQRPWPPSLQPQESITFRIII